MQEYFSQTFNKKTKLVHDFKYLSKSLGSFSSNLPRVFSSLVPNFLSFPQANFWALHYLLDVKCEKLPPKKKKHHITHKNLGPI